MRSFKDIWFDEFARLQSEYEDRGLSPEEAEARATTEAFDRSYDVIADAADNARDRAKYKDC
jgi:hypothetical protein